MADQRRDVSYPSLTLPYADPRIVLVPIPIHNTINQAPVAVPSQTGLGKFLPSFLLFFFLLYMIYQIILAGFNCSLESTNLEWIRASFFLNIPFLLTACIYLIQNCIKKELPSLFFLWFIISLHSLIFINYVLLMGIYFEVDELKKIKGALRNATVIDSLPCSTNYYENVYNVKILQYCFTLLCSIIFCLSSATQSENRKNAIHPLNFLIINKWRRFINILYRRHQNEIIIEQY